MTTTTWCDIIGATWETREFGNGVAVGAAAGATPNGAEVVEEKDVLPYIEIEKSTLGRFGLLSGCNGIFSVVSMSKKCPKMLSQCRRPILKMLSRCRKGVI